MSKSIWKFAVGINEDSRLFHDRGAENNTAIYNQINNLWVIINLSWDSA